jgi:GH35 family endo-1,4-beta-xylanase
MMKMAHEQSAHAKSVTSVLTLCLLFGVAEAVRGDWKSEANARIEQIRKRNAEITVVDSNDQPVPGVSIQIDQIKHHFAFGSAINWLVLYNANYADFFRNHFEWAVCESEAKWPTIEQTRDVENYYWSDNIYNWCNNNGIIMRGHCLFWEQGSQVQQWVKDLNYAPYPTPSELLDEIDERITSAVSHFTGKYRHWDVDNEILASDFYNRFGEAGRVHMFQLAHAVDPCCKLFMNEYTGNSFGSYDPDGYIARANSLRAMGAPIDCLGIQSHLSIDVNLDPQRYYNDILQPLATQVGLPLWITEFDVPHWDVNQRADNLEKFYRMAFSHPSVEGVLMWGFWENAHWRDNAYIVDANWVLNEAGLRYEALMDEWTTNDVDGTNLAGKANFRGFHGTYEITLSAIGQTPEIHIIELEPGETPAQFLLQTDIFPVPEDVPPTPDPLVWGAVPTPTSPTSITMTAATAVDDSWPVRYFFECTTDANSSSDWQKNPTYTATGLNPGTRYEFRVKARDNAPIPNETGWSGTESATTYAAPVDIIGSWVTDTTHTKEPGANRALIFIAHAEDDEDPSIVLDSVSYGGQPMTKIVESVVGYTINSRVYVAAFILNEADINVADGDTFDVSWNQTPDSAAYISVFFANVDQAAPVDANASNGTMSGSTITTAELPTNNADMVIVAATCSGTGTYTVNNGFTTAYELPITAADAVVGYKSATGFPETPSVTHVTSTNRQVIIGFVLKQAPLVTGYQTCSDVQAGGDGLLSDLNGDCYVDYLDLETVALYWLFTDCAGPDNCENSDFEPDGDVDFVDFSTFGLQWLECNDPQDAYCSPNWEQ